MKAEDLGKHEKEREIEHLQHQIRYLQRTVEDQTGIIKMYCGTIGDIPSGWNLCDGTQGTCDLSDKFIRNDTENERDEQKEPESYALCFIVKMPNTTNMVMID